LAINASVFSAPTNVMALGHPFISPGYNNILGVPIGIDVRSRKLVYFDPMLLKNAGLINSAYGIVIAPIGYGKSATLKIISCRLMMIAAGYDRPRTMINDYKPEGKESEYSAFSRVFRSKVFSIASMSINPFEAKLYMDSAKQSYELGILGTAEAMAEFAKKDALSGYENTALRTAVHAMLQLNEAMWSPHVLYKLMRSLSAEQIATYFDRLDKKLESQLEARISRIQDSGLKNTALDQAKELVGARDNHSYDEIKSASDRNSTYLGNILTGSYADMFGDTHSLYATYTQRAVTKDWRGLDPEAETLMRTIDTRIKVSAVENNRTDLLPHIELDDEKHKSMDNMVYAKSHAYLSEIARGTHTTNLSATHRFNSIRKGAVGSELYNLGNTIINNLGFAFIGQQVDDPKILDELQDRYHLSNNDTKALTMLPKYTFGLKLGEGEPIRFIKIFATPQEMEILKTDGSTDRMIDRPDVYSPEQIERYARENGIDYIGQD
jgi:hypothetical protein